MNFKKNISLIIGVFMFGTIIAVSIFAPYLTSYDPLEVRISQRLLPMSTEHYFGTDFWGRDVLSRIFYGGRYSLTIGLFSIGISMILGLIFGLLAGFYSESKLAKFIIWITDITMSFPTLILGAMVAIVFGPGFFNTIIAIAIAFWPRFVRLARASTLSAKEEVFILAAKSVGMSDWRIVCVHLIPNIISPVIVMAIIWASDAITIEVALSFLGLGVPPPTPSWGTVLQDNLRYFRMSPAAVIWPCIAIAWAVQSLNLVGDRFRDILDPKMR